jgi:hypothetical protein
MVEVHEDGIGADIGVLCQVDPCKVLVLDEGWAVRLRKRGECEGAL